MRHLREILRHKLLLRRSHRETARSVGVSCGSVAGAVSRANAVGLDWAAISAMSEDALDERLYGPRGGGREGRPMPDPANLHVELRKTGVTLQLLHLEYLESHPNGYRYTKFCEVYRDWLERRGPTMRQTHEVGDKLFVDYSGKKPSIVDPKTGEVIEVELFVAVLGASNYTYAEATRTQRVHDFIGSHVRALAFFGGVPRLLVPDQLRSGVRAPCSYEPGIQRTYEELAQHYGTAVLPARAGRPRDKAKVEVGVLVAQRWILARLRNQTFFSLAELNERIAELCEQLNDRQMRLYGESRRQLFERIERAALGPLPAERFECSEWKEVRVNIDYHVEVYRHYVFGPAPFAARKARCAHHSDHGRAFSAWSADHVTCAQSRPWPAHHQARAHAGVAPKALAMDAVAAHRVGHNDRRIHRAAGRAHHRGTTASRARLPLVSGHLATVKALRLCAPRSCMRPRAARQRAVVQARRVNAQARARSTSAARRRQARDCGSVPPQRARPRLLQLKERRC